MPPWLATVLLFLGKPALILVLRIIEAKYPGSTPFIEAVIAYLEGAKNKTEAMQTLQKHCEGLFCPADLVKE